VKNFALMVGAGLLALGSVGTAEAQARPVEDAWSQYREKVVVRRGPVVRKKVVVRPAPVYVSPAPVYVPQVVVRTPTVVQKRVVVRPAPVVRERVIVR
jgi:hypothetical protein